MNLKVWNTRKYLSNVYRNNYYILWSIDNHLELNIGNIVEIFSVMWRDKVHSLNKQRKEYRKYEFLAIAIQKVDNILGNPTTEKSIKRC